MSFQLQLLQFRSSLSALENNCQGLLLINTINAHSYNIARKDPEFAKALKASDVLLPDGISIVWAKRFLSTGSGKQQAVSGKQNTEMGAKILKRIAGWDLFVFEMNRLQTTDNRQQKKAFFLGSSESVLAKIKARAAVDYPNVEVYTYSPPYKPEFTEEDNLAMYKAIEEVQPDVLFVGMTAPKQEKWAYELVKSYKLQVTSEESVGSRESGVGSSESGVLSQESVVGSEDSELRTQNSKLKNSELKTQNSKLPTNCHVCCIGAVFDFYAGTVERAPLWWQEHGLEWLFRLIKEPRRMWRRYIIGNIKFIGYIILEKFNSRRI